MHGSPHSCTTAMVDCCQEPWRSVNALRSKRAGMDTSLADAYAADGAVVVRAAVVPEWIDRLLAPAQLAISAALEAAAETGFPPDLKNLWLREPLFRAFASESGVASLAAQAAG